MKLPRRHSISPTIAVLQMYGVEPSLDAWLDFNDVSDVLMPNYWKSFPRSSVTNTMTVFA
jgi:hypothetical protein